MHWRRCSPGFSGRYHLPEKMLTDQPFSKQLEISAKSARGTSGTPGADPAPDEGQAELPLRCVDSPKDAAGPHACSTNPAAARPSRITAVLTFACTQSLCPTDSVLCTKIQL